MKLRLFSVLLTAFVMQITAVYAGPVGYVSSRPATAVSETPKTNLFSIEGNSLKFILLDVDEEGFFCTTKEFYGTQPFDPDGTGKFDIEDNNNIAYWLNTTFIEDGGEIWNSKISSEKYIFPSKILEYAIERDWLCEAGYSATDYNEDYTVKAKLSLMSVTEWKKYNGKIGYADNTHIAYYYWLRSVNGTIEPGDAAPVMVVSSGGTAQFGKVRNGYGIRPVFYLDRSFFTNVKLDISLLGDNVKKILRENFLRDELRGIYDSSELEKIYKKLPPQAVSVNMSGVTQTGYLLEGTYKYESPEGEEEFNSEYRWLRSKKIDGPFSVIKGANSTEFQIRDIDEGYYFAFEVIPKSKSGVGVAVRSKVSATPVAKDFPCYAENVYIDGTPEIGERLIARYNYHDENRDVEDGTVIKWQNSDDGENFSDIKGSTGLNYVISANDEGKYLRFQINVKSINSDIYAETVFSDVIGPVEESKNDTVIRTIIDRGIAKILSNITAGADVPFWVVRNTDGALSIENIGKAEYAFNGAERNVKAGIFRTGYGTLSKIVYSELIEQPKQNENSTKDTVFANGGETEIKLKSNANQLAHSLKIQFECNGIKIENVTSDSYRVSISGKEENTVILTGIEKEQLLIPDEVLNVVLSGIGELKIKYVEGIYEINGDIVKTVPNLFFE
jgi:hypothetical protein